jgi:hypothetical protein
LKHTSQSIGFRRAGPLQITETRFNECVLMLGIVDDERPPTVQLFDDEIAAVDVGSIEMKDVVPSSFLREATELCHFPKSRMVAPSCVRTASPPSTGEA